VLTTRLVRRVVSRRTWYATVHTVRGEELPHVRTTLVFTTEDLTAARAATLSATGEEFRLAAAVRPAAAEVFILICIVVVVVMAVVLLLVV